MRASVAAVKLGEIALTPVGLDILVPLSEVRRGMVHLRTREAECWVFSLGCATKNWPPCIVCSARAWLATAGVGWNERARRRWNCYSPGNW